VRFSPDRVEEALSGLRESTNSQPPAFAPVILKPYDYASNIVDPETDTIRPITCSDLIQMTRLVDSLRTLGYPIEGGCPGFAQDLPEPLRTINQSRISIQYSQTGREKDLLTTREADYIYRMQEVMNWLPMNFPLFILSPLRIDDASLDHILNFLDRGASITISIGAMPLLGATTPISLHGALVQATAEVLASFTLARIIAGERAVSLGIKLFSFDMHYMNVSLGSAEEMLLASICKEITDFYMPGAGYSPYLFSRYNPYLFSMGKFPGQQTAAEKMANALSKALAGFPVVTCGGATASTIFSPEQLINDCEIIAYVNRVLKGFSLDMDDDAIEVIQECVDAGGYLDHPTTVRGYRSTFWFPRLFEHEPYQSNSVPKPNPHARVKSLIRDQITSHSYRLDPERFQKIEAIYQEAAAELSLV
jgi:trimethylamine--corrinoid protein Co-methyltransferase